MKKLLVVAVLLASIFAPFSAYASTEGRYTPDDARAAIHWAAVHWGVSERTMLRVALCETGGELDPYARGDFRNGHATSFGLYQLSSLEGTGLLDHFHAQGYETAWSPWASAAYFARVLSGEWADEYIGPWRWSCY